MSDPLDDQDVYVGKAGARADWRSGLDEAEDQDPDDEPLGETPADVVDALGFDPLEGEPRGPGEKMLAGMLAIAREWNEEDHPRDDDGKFGDGGGGGVSEESKPEPESADGSEKARAKIDAPLNMEYAKGLDSDMRARIGKQGGFGGKDIYFALSYRSTSDMVKLAEHVEDGSDRESMIRALDSGARWSTGWAAADDEWNAARALGATDSRPKVAGGTGAQKPLSDKDVAGFAARREFMQEWFKKQHAGDSMDRDGYAKAIDPDGYVTVYRGVRGKQGKEVVGKIQRGEREQDLAVHGLSSWSIYRSSATKFASGKSGKILKDGSVLSTKIHVSEIWWAQGIIDKTNVIRFSDDAGEVVVLSKDKSRKVSVVK